MKPRECDYCESVINFDKYGEHVDYCGSKTKKCVGCGANVMARELVIHMTGGQC